MDGSLEAVSSTTLMHPGMSVSLCIRTCCYLLSLSLARLLSKSFARDQHSCKFDAHSLENSTSVSIRRSPLQMYLYLPRVYYFSISKLFRSAFYTFPQQTAKLTLLSLAYTHTAVLQQSYFPCWLCANICTCLSCRISLFSVSHTHTNKHTYIPMLFPLLSI